MIGAVGIVTAEMTCCFPFRAKPGIFIVVKNYPQPGNGAVDRFSSLSF